MFDLADPLSLYSFYKLDLIGTEDVWQFAMHSLSKTSTSELLAISICNHADEECIVLHAQRWFCQMGFNKITTIDLLRIFATEVAHRILLGSLSPKDGADLIAKTVYKHHKLEFHELDTFVYASSELEDRPEDQSLFESAIIEEATEWDGRRVALWNSFAI